jgi:methylornithine synthase
MLTQKSGLTQLLFELENGYQIKKSEIIYLLGLSEPGEINLLFEAAQRVREDQFGNKVFLYGFLYFSTHCKNSCRFCQYRESNTSLPRYRKTEEEILLAAEEIAKAGVHLIDMTMGEDPEYYSSQAPGFTPLTTMIQRVQQKTKLPVMISLGSLPDEILGQLADSGADWFACYQETHNQDLYHSLRPHQSFSQRIAKKEFAKKQGMLIEEGILTGVGESLEDIADSIIWMKENGVDQARIMTFVPQAHTPMASSKIQDDLQELITIAVMRLTLPNRLIPASLDVNGLKGLAARLTAGANVVTSIVPPEKGLAGVANNSLDIEDSRRTLEHILPIIEQCGLKPASQKEYRSWLTTRKLEHSQHTNCEKNTGETSIDPVKEK